MSELVIFGRSPFINQIDVELLLGKYRTLGFNHFGELHPVDFLFLFDHPVKAKPNTVVYYPKHMHRTNGIRYIHKVSKRPILPEKRQEGMLCLGHKYYTVSLALNWALLQGFKKIYLVGIDHVETDRRFVHHDGRDCRSELTPQSHRELKQYVYRCARHAEIYQCNPAVRTGWELPYKDIEELYAKSQVKTEV